MWNIPSTYVTAIPTNFLSKQIITTLNKKNINTEKIIYCGQRIGIYYLPQGKDLKNESVIYDRTHSAFSTLHTEKIDWDKLFDGVSHFHFSAICPALNQETANLCLEAIQKANEKKIIVSLDLNYREKLWQYGKKANEIMPDLAAYCQIIMGNIWAANKMLDIPLNEKIKTKNEFLEHAAETSKHIIKKFPCCTHVANTFRFDDSKNLEYFGTLFTQDTLYHSKTFHTTNESVNKVGSGDCFMASLLYGLYIDQDPQEIIDFAALATFDKLFLSTDSTSNTVELILQNANHYSSL